MPVELRSARDGRGGCRSMGVFDVGGL